MICHERKFIFIHIPKTAGHSIDTLFTSHKMVGEALWHYSASELIDHLGLESFSQFYKFTVVRNPWDRIVSEYIWQGSNFKTQIQTPWGNKEISFKDFVKSIKDFPSDHRFVKDSKDLHFYYPPKEIKNGHLSDQYSFIVDKSSNIVVDKIIRYENLQTEFDATLKEIGISQKTLPHMNKTKHKHYTEYYDDETRGLIAEKYAKDIEYFGYEFGD